MLLRMVNPLPLPPLFLFHHHPFLIAGSSSLLSFFASHILFFSSFCALCLPTPHSLPFPHSPFSSCNFTTTSSHGTSKPYPHCASHFHQIFLQREDPIYINPSIRNPHPNSKTDHPFPHYKFHLMKGQKRKLVIIGPALPPTS